MPNLTIKANASAMQNLVPVLDDLEIQLAALMGVPVSACNVMVVAVQRPKTSTVSAYMELMFMASEERSRAMIGDVGQALMGAVRAAIGGDVQFRGFPMTAQTLFAESFVG